MSHPFSFEIRQELQQEADRWRESLPPPPIPLEMTGLKFRVPDPRDDDLADYPPVAARLAVGYPETFDLTKYLKGTYNQQQIPSCVAHTMGAMQSGHQQQEEGQWRTFDCPRAHSETGPLMEGRWPDALLKYCVERGMPLANSEQRYRIAAYAFVQNDSRWADVIKAAIAAEQFITVALLLPSQFGWESNTQLTSGYHEVLICGYDRDRLLIKNSWGENWSRSGYGWIPIAHFLQANFQNSHVLAHAPTDERTSPQPLPDPGPQPLPDPRPEPEPEPEPRPSPIRVTGYGASKSVPAVEAGQAFGVLGDFGEGQGVLQVSWGIHPLQVRERGPQALTVVAPPSTGLNSLSVRLEGTLAEGPPLAVIANGRPQPDPLPEPKPEPEPGGLEVTARLFGNPRGIFMTVRVSGLDGEVEISVWQDGQQKETSQIRRVRGNGQWHPSPIFIQGLARGRDCTIRAEGGGKSGETVVRVP